ncbi:hypothetical protein [Eleftheria terrae]|uniref:hypothetical protein n=1 Tax=Eleftheria terrae TaxID=1597781 RepID=UPI00263AC20F|nr:hypothetical protein [Eleftheria terrae]WKB55371.1 hypothetical protein N7L95_25145 [Eleftheria terrae]
MTATSSGPDTSPDATPASTPGPGPAPRGAGSLLRAGLCTFWAAVFGALALLTAMTVAGRPAGDQRLALSLAVFLGGACALQLSSARHTGRALLFLLLALPVVLVDLLWLASLALGALLSGVQWRIG